MQDVPYGVAIVPEGTPMLADGQGFDVSRVGIEGDDDLVDGPVIHRAQVRRGQSYRTRRRVASVYYSRLCSPRHLSPATPYLGSPSLLTVHVSRGCALLVSCP